MRVKVMKRSQGIPHAISAAPSSRRIKDTAPYEQLMVLFAYDL